MIKPFLKLHKNQLLLKLVFLALIFIPQQYSAQTYPLSDPTNTGSWILNLDVSDEFEDAAINETKWLIQGREDGNGDPQYQSNFIGRIPSQFSTENAILENGRLKILTKWEPSYPFYVDPNADPGDPKFGEYEGVSKPITTAAVISKQQFQYGYMEIMCKSADAEITSSFWTTGPGGPVGASELDMFEMFGGHATSSSWRKRLKFNIISWDPNNSIKIAQNALTPPQIGTTHTRNIQAANNTADAFHVYGFEWTAEYIKVYIDGVLHPNGTILKSDITDNGNEPDRWVTDVPYWVWFDSETFPWLGLPDESDLSTPAEYQIEYIRVWQTNAPSDQVSVSGTTNAAEPDVNGAFTVNLPSGVLASEDIVVNYNVTGTATNGTDYTNLTGTVTILNGNNSVIIPVVVSGDTDIEGNETIIITLSSTSVGIINTTPAEINIADELIGTILTAGDIALVGWKAEGTNNGAVAFMLLKDIIANTKISFSNRSWKGSQDGWTGNYSVDDVWTWKSGAAYSMGDIFKLDSDGNVKISTGGSEQIVGSMTHNVLGKIDSSDDDSDFDLSISGDSVLIYQVYGVFAEPTDPNSSAWITGLNTNGDTMNSGWGTGGGNTFCALPSALTNGLNSNEVGLDQDNGVYVGELLGNASSLRASINNSSNWITDEVTNYNLWSYEESVDANSGDIGSAGTLSISNYKTENSISLYPNPINTSLFKSINISSPETKHIVLYNITGAQLLSVEKTTEPFKLHVEGLKSGLYFISFIFESTTETKKIIVK